MLASNDILGYYRLIERIGAGGMGEVWKAEDTRLGRSVAVKILPPAIAGDQDAIARMRREARLAAQLNHPNIATIHSFEEIGERLFIVMELVEGEPLSRLIQRGPIPEADLCRIGRSVAEALAEAHAKGIVHRDIKPDNIMVSGTRVKVLDFGIAKQIEVQPGSNDPTAPLLTQQGMILGTVQYMSPEQALAKKLDARTDIFSLGVVLYQAATGVLPFAGESVTETITKIVRDDPPPLTRASSGFAAIVNRCLRKKCEERFATAADLAGALDAQMVRASTAPMTYPTAPPTVLTTVTQTRPPRWTWGALTAVVAAVVAAIGIGLRHDRVAPAASAPPTIATATTTQPAPAGPALTVTVAPPTTTMTSAVPEETAKPAVPEPRPTADEFFALGVDALIKHRLREAHAHFMRAHLRDPNSLKAELGLALAEGDRSRAAAIDRRLREQGVSDPNLNRLREFVEERVEQKRERPRRFPGRRP